MALLGSTWLYHSSTKVYTSLYHTLPGIYLVLHNSTIHYHGSTWLYNTAVFGSQLGSLSEEVNENINMGYSQDQGYS